MDNNKNTKKQRKNISNIFKEIVVFFKKEILKTFLILLSVIVIMVLCLVTLNIGNEDINMNNSANASTEASVSADTNTSVSDNEQGENQIDNSKIGEMSVSRYVMENLLKLLLVIGAGFVPYVYLGVLGVLGSVIDTVSMFLITVFYSTLTSGQVLSGGNLILIYLVIIVNVIVYSLAIALSIYICRINTKKFRFSSQSEFGFRDMAININKMLGREKQANNIKETKDKRTEVLKNKVVTLEIQKVLILTLPILILNILVSIITYNI